MSEIDTTLAAVEIHQWRVVLLAPRSKLPTGPSWRIVTDTEAIRWHYDTGGNLGLVCGQVSSTVVFDFDVPDVLAEMSQELGPLVPTVLTGRNRHHCYVAWEDELPSRILWKGERVGEIQRGPGLQHATLPPSLHPVTGRPYRWAQDPRGPLPLLPEEWRKYLTEIPDYIAQDGPLGQPEDEVWEGPPVEELLRRAMLEPGAVRRRNGVKFQCRGCRDEGHDNSKDNAIVYNDGRWGCALGPEHRKDIAVQLGVVDDDGPLALEVFPNIPKDILKGL